MLRHASEALPVVTAGRLRRITVVVLFIAAFAFVAARISMFVTIAVLYL